ncbi:hypothetical protein JTB14_011986 [Gonioctena quinquepunctata]|nr:hypothetical protein JTB14_011986 [Gonioctena quinquepunctata]
MWILNILSGWKFITVLDIISQHIFGKSMSYEKEQLRLQNLMQELLSDEKNSLFGDVYTSDEYHPESDDSSDSDSSSLSASFRKSKRMKKETRASDQVEFMIH